MQELIKYLKQVIDKKTVIEPYNAKNLLSPYLAGSYEFYIVRLLETSFYLVKPLEERTIGQLQVQLAKMETKLELPVAIYKATMTRYQQRKCMTEKIPFISGDHQTFLPFLGLHLKEMASKPKEQMIHEHFTPTMQLVFLWILYREKNTCTQQEISTNLHVTAMTASRALESFVSMDLLEYSVEGKTGRKKIYHCKKKQEYYEKGKSYLINPVKRIFYVAEIPESMDYYMSDLSALAKKTMIGNPDHFIVAIKGEDVAKIMNDLVTRDQALEEHLYEVQELKYDFTLLTEDRCVDPVTLICMLKEKDERIEISIEEMMEKYTWYRE